MQRAAPVHFDRPLTDDSGAFSRVVVIVPALNEATSLPLVLRDLPAFLDYIVTWLEFGLWFAWLTWNGWQTSMTRRSDLS